MRFLMILLVLMTMLACEEENNNPLKSDPELEGRFSVLSVTYSPPDPPTESKATQVSVSFVNWGETIYDRSIFIQVALIDFNNQRYTSGRTLPGIQGGGAITRFEIVVWGVEHQQVNLYEVAFTYN